VETATGAVSAGYAPARIVWAMMVTPIGSMSEAAAKPEVRGVLAAPH
jgi:hypothetical protein